jgi:hypothetical protein
MKTIWKYPIKKADIVEIIMPAAAEILTAQWQNEEPCIWALVNPFEQKNETRTFEIFGTGKDVPVGMGVERKYINTFQMPSQIGPLVFHIFERIN